MTTGAYLQLAVGTVILGLVYIVYLTLPHLSYMKQKRRCYNAPVFFLLDPCFDVKSQMSKTAPKPIPVAPLTPAANHSNSCLIHHDVVFRFEVRHCSYCFPSAFPGL